ncbi:MAG TPA: flagellar hook-length control protein FliK [Geobacteraceae bacterium]|nr:flagellar hook-length control protein FliK [Geobacteraceae bacterium]
MKITIDYWRSLLSLTRVSEGANAAEKHPEPFRNLAPGQQVRGDVLARLSDNTYLVKISGNIYRTELPEPIRPGSTLALTFRGSEPRPEFSLQRDPTKSSPVRISPVTAWLTETIGNSPRQPSPQSLTNIGTLLESPATNTAALATSLRNALAFSGIFYESHLAQWLLGERLLNDIQKESRLRLAFMAKNIKKTESVKTIFEKLGLVPGDDNPLNTGPSEKGATTEPPRLPGLDEPHSSPLVRQQLETLLSSIFRWQGMAWENQDMEWEVEKQEKKDDREENQSWRTTIRLQLPNLGSINATLMIAEDGIHGKITTGLSATRHEMQKELAYLERTMADSGLILKDMVIEHEEAG